MRERVEMDRLRELVRLHRLGNHGRKVARLLKMSPNTERGYRLALQAAGVDLKDAGLPLPELEELKGKVEAQRPRVMPPQQVTSLSEWVAALTALRHEGLGPQAAFDRLRLSDERFAGRVRYGAVKRWYRSQRRAEGVRAEDVAIPVVTAPGEVAQVDFGYVGRLRDPDTGARRKAYVFTMVLGHSRHQFAYLVFDQTVDTWLQLHVRAFDFFGGVPRTIVPDNLKAAVIQAAFLPSQPTSLNRSYRELARHYGFQVDPAPPYQPKKKGKAESGIKYVKGNFLSCRDDEDAGVLQPELTRWVVDIAGTRLHGSTGRQPLAVFEQEEKPALLPLPSVRFEPVVWKEATVHADSHVLFERRMYSVPWRLIEKKVWLRATPAAVCVYWDDTRVATHERRGTSLHSTHDAHLPMPRADLRHRDRAYWEHRGAGLGAECATYLKGLFDSDTVLSQLRAAQAAVLHLEKFPKERAQAACRRASYFGTFGYGTLKNILARGLDLEPLPVAVAPSAAPTERFRFARSAHELLTHLEKPHEPHG